MGFGNKMTGMIPTTEPKMIIHYTVATSPVFKYGPVKIAAGKISPLPTPAATIVTAGVALEYGAVGDVVPVCVDQDMLYSVLVDGGSLANLENMGNYYSDGVNNGTTGTSEGQSLMKLDYTDAASSADANTYMKLIVPAFGVGELAATTGVHRMLVRLLRLEQSEAA
jgi:hypothetical protein